MTKKEIENITLDPLKKLTKINACEFDKIVLNNVDVYYPPMRTEIRVERPMMID